MDGFVLLMRGASRLPDDEHGLGHTKYTECTPASQISNTVVWRAGKWTNEVNAAKFSAQ